jgi:hypothetical protein
MDTRFFTVKPELPIAEGVHLFKQAGARSRTCQACMASRIRVEDAG